MAGWGHGAATTHGESGEFIAAGRKEIQKKVHIRSSAGELQVSLPAEEVPKATAEELKQKKVTKYPMKHAMLNKYL